MESLSDVFAWACLVLYACRTLEELSQRYIEGLDGDIRANQILYPRAIRVQPMRPKSEHEGSIDQAVRNSSRDLWHGVMS